MLTNHCERLRFMYFILQSKEENKAMKQYVHAFKFIGEILRLLENSGWDQEVKTHDLGDISPGRHCLTTGFEQIMLEQNISVTVVEIAIQLVEEEIGDIDAPNQPEGLDVPYWGAKLVAWNDNVASDFSDVRVLLGNARKKALERYKCNSNTSAWIGAEILLFRAKQTILNGDWHQGDKQEQSSSASCLTEALEEALKKQNSPLTEFYYAKYALEHVALGQKSPIQPEVYWGKQLMEWNDSPGRQKNEVITLFDEAINYVSSKY